MSTKYDLIKELLKGEEIIQINKLEQNIQKLNCSTLCLIDKQLFDEMKLILDSGNALFYFGKTLCDIKCVLSDEDNLRVHELFLRYKGPKKLVVSSVNMPHSSLQDREYERLGHIINNYKAYIKDLSLYFYELDRIDRFCTVMEPSKPSYRDDFRRILIDDRIWLHVNVTHDGLATNIHLVGHSELWQDKLQSGLLTWDHDKDIVENIMSVFEITEFPAYSHTSLALVADDKPAAEAITCGICLCNELPNMCGVPQPLCQNPICGVYFHKNCLYQWLVACSGSRPPAFGVATGSCPACLQPITCSGKDST